MAVHDWTRVDAGIFHSLHTSWIVEIHNALNEGLLPEGYYALAEQHAGKTVPDLLTLHANPAATYGAYSPPTGGGLAVAEAPPQVRVQDTVEAIGMRRRTLAIRHITGHRLIAMVEILSPANKDREGNLEALLEKSAAALEAGVHLLIVDLFPPGPHDPQGFHGAFKRYISEWSKPYDLPAAEPLTLAAYAAGSKIETYLEHLAVGGRMPDMPLFLRADRYVNLPLQTTYDAAYRGMPAFWRDVLEGKSRQ